MASEDICNLFNGGQCLAELDLAQAYSQTPAEAESRQLLTINTHRGLHQ